MVSKIAWTLLLRLVCFINTITIIAEISKGSKLVISVKRTVVFYIWCFGLFIFKLRSLSQKDVNVISTHNSQFSHSFDRMIQVTSLPSSYQGLQPIEIERNTLSKLRHNQSRKKITVYRFGFLYKVMSHEQIWQEHVQTPTKAS